MSKKLDKMKAWIELARPPFHTVGVLPFVLGSVIAWRQKGLFDWPVFGISVCGVVFIMLATYFAGEYWDFAEDTISGGRNRFAGGSQVLQKRRVSRRAVLIASILNLCLAAVIGVILQFVLKTGSWTIPLGVVGMIGGFFYSTRPIRWVSTGFGEVWIALCYGWLPVAAGYYLQAGTFTSLIHWLSIPIGLSIFNVILLNEYPDYEADSYTGKMNLLVRIGRARGTYVYTIAAVLAWSTTVLSVINGVPVRVLFFYTPVFVVSLLLVISMVRGNWQNHRVLEKLCAATILVNLGTTVAFIITFIGSGYG